MVVIVTVAVVIIITSKCINFRSCVVNVTNFFVDETRTIETYNTYICGYMSNCDTELDGSLIMSSAVDKTDIHSNNVNVLMECSEC